MNFTGVENTVFFEPKIWWKCDIYWLLKSYCFEPFRYGKYGLFWDKKLRKRYLLIIEMFLFWTFRGWKIRPFLRQKVDGKIIFTGYWKVLVLSFSVMENFLRQKFNGKMIFTDYWNVLVLGYQKVPVLSFSLMGNTVFFYKKGNFYVVFLSFLILQDPGNTAFRAVINSICSDELLHTEVSQLKIVGDLT